jgi:peptidoglycan/xylan/chitin deacetylase (PgdA/CDA1 family)
MRAILAYHSIDPSGSVISIHPDAFERHLRAFEQHGVRVVGLETLLSLDDDAHAVALTFDDAFLNFATIAWPRLRARGFTATVFVPTAFAGRTNDWAGGRRLQVPRLPLLGWDALARLADDGVELGSHTRSHPDLRRLDTIRLLDEIEAAADRVRAETGIRPASFAYPFGFLDDAVAAAVARVHERACTMEHRALRTVEDPFRLPRLDVFYLRRPETLPAWGSFLFRGRLWARARARAVRATLVDLGVMP